MSESKKPYTLHFVWLDGCGGCITFKKTQQPAFEEMIRNHPSMSYMNHEYKRVPIPHINDYISWFPTFILTKNNQVVDVFNANIEVKNGIVSCEHAQKMPLTAENLIRWAETVMNKPGYIQDNSQSIGSQRFVSKTCRSTNNYRPSN